MLSSVRGAQEQCAPEQIVRLDAAVGPFLAGRWRLRHLPEHRVAGGVGFQNPYRICQREKPRLAEWLVDGAAQRAAGALLRLARQPGGRLYLAGWRRAHLHSALPRSFRALWIVHRAGGDFPDGHPTPGGVRLLPLLRTAAVKSSSGPTAKSSSWNEGERFNYLHVWSRSRSGVVTQGAFQFSPRLGVLA